MSTTKDFKYQLHSSRYKLIDKLNIFTKEDLTKEKVLNTLNILSGQDITKTQLYKTMLTADEHTKKSMIALSSVFASVFGTYGIYLKTTNIYMWLEILFDRFKAEEGIDMKNDMFIGIERAILEKFPIGVIPTGEAFKGVSLFAFEYAMAWSTVYQNPDRSTFEKIAKIIQPDELFILTAITIMSFLCHIHQMPFEFYVNMPFKIIVNYLKSYQELHEFVYNKYEKSKIDDINIEYAVLNALVNEHNHMQSKLGGKLVLNVRFTDEAFGKIIKVSKKSEYEKLKTLYKN